MSLSESTLFLDYSSLPSTDAIVERISTYGYAIAFPPGFSLADRSHSFWLPLTLDGDEVGFDYFVMPAARQAGEEPYDPPAPAFGDIALGFVARRHQSSLLASSLVQRAICELSDAMGYWQSGDGAVSNPEMIELMEATIASIKANPEPYPASAPKPAGRLPENYFANIGKALLGGIGAIAAAAAFVFGMAYLNGAGQS